ncbi:MAG: hypothetical protein M3Y58_16025 [Chloroflexota bacterium]|nr:hypothetical protein [Chloroflexota bacterium]
MATAMPVKECQSHWLPWRIAVPVLTLLFVLFPAIMTFPGHEEARASIAATPAVPVQMGVQETCPPADLCVAVAVEQALPRLPVPPLLLFGVVLLFFAMRRQYHMPTYQSDWWWPPAQRRALLQVFLI